MKITMRCSEHEKDVKVKEIYIAESGAINIYLTCGCHIHDYELKQREPVGWI